MKSRLCRCGSPIIASIERHAGFEPDGTPIRLVMFRCLNGHTRKPEETALVIPKAWLEGYRRVHGL